MPKKLTSFVFLLLICLPLSAQEQASPPEAKESEDFSIGPGAVVALYSPVNLSYGGSLAVAYGSGTSMGIKASWLLDPDGQPNILILDILFRWYFFGSSANSGLFIQFAGGPAVFFEREENISFPARIGTLTAGLTLGWRFLNILILDILFRWYFFGSSANSGLFIQFAGGPAVFFEREENISFPARIGTLTAGLTLGWRFLLGKYFYLEPSISGGYPYLAGAGLCAGVRF